MSLSTGLANVSLKYNRWDVASLLAMLICFHLNLDKVLIKSTFLSVGFYQMAKIAVTPTIVLAELMLFRKRVSFQKV